MGKPPHWQRSAVQMSPRKGDIPKRHSFLVFQWAPLQFVGTNRMTPRLRVQIYFKLTLRTPKSGWLFLVLSFFSLSHIVYPKSYMSEKNFSSPHIDLATLNCWVVVWKSFSCSRDLSFLLFESEQYFIGFQLI